MNRYRQKAFTLMEMLIALLLTGLVMTLIFTSLRLTAKGWDAAERRQTQIAEQYQVQQLLRRLIGQARNERVRDVDSILQSAFRGDSDQLIFVAPARADSQDASLLWYRLRLEPGEDDESAALVLETRAFRSEEIVDWSLLFEEEPEVGLEEPLPAPRQSYRLMALSEPELRFRYMHARPGELAELSESWIESNELPMRVDLMLTSDAEQSDTPVLLPAWQELSFSLKEYAYAVRVLGF
ncbi:prepilin-type N-terminal cleavage/methylation domain-containing protein [Marinobacterium sp. D7]|uniref:PulJ/GspJ family protein n=1 Tax=Marinobacterium ramblicola TaxID=2849041 RepID=UPI001C2D39E4|nr:prepilin-type N-terminal cleavage/methylation domain-containing protein [Marinobacterium ramblicola]MBV1787978.1 prepilin-type N-terminal cleavage/methylation domain-containing protein [Marinobacterium ramblicola]